MRNKNMYGIAKRLLFLMLFSIAVIGASNSTFAANNNTFSFTNSGIVATNTSESGYKIEGTALTISEAGTYTITGSCEEGSIKVKKRDNRGKPNFKRLNSN